MSSECLDRTHLDTNGHRWSTAFKHRIIFVLQVFEAGSQRIFKGNAPFFGVAGEEIDCGLELTIHDVPFSVRFGVRLVHLLWDPDIGPGCDHGVVADPLPLLDVLGYKRCLILRDRWFE